MSRLLDGNINYNGTSIPIEEYRDMIFARSLYSFSNEYVDGNKLTLRNKSLVSDSIASVLNVIPQYGNIQTQLGLLTNVLQPTPLTEIGTIMLGKQMFYNSAMNLSTRYLPIIDTSQILKGNLKGVFKRNIDNRITSKDQADKTGLEKIAGFGEKFLGVETYDVFGNANPFNKTSNSIDFIKNTGSGQLSFLFKALNKNQFKPIDAANNSDYTNVIREYSKDSGTDLLKPSDTLSSYDRVYFTFNNSKSNPYFKRSISVTAIDSANTYQLISADIDGGDEQLYAPTYQSIKENFGSPVKEINRTVEDYVQEKSNHLIDNETKHIVWGRDGLAPEAEANLSNLRGEDDAMNLKPEETNFETQNIRTGILDYTRNLLNATEGNFIDTTRKVFKDGDEVVGYNGSPLWRGNNTTYSRYSGNADKVGVREHTTLDQYNKFAKLIRFDGNKVYNGSDQSVINKTVYPRIHPSDDSKDGNKNLMFSIENLAVGTIRRETERYGVIDDEYGTPIPLSEVGPFNGRLMWFPPYNLQINEAAIAKFEPTVMVGRNEPMYNYMNSERTATLSFTLVVDYPEQLRNYASTKEDKHKEIADFFAFGGDPLPDEVVTEKIQKKIDDLKKLKLEIKGPDDEIIPSTIPSTAPISVYFPNDRPTNDEITGIFNTMYNPLTYEIVDGLLSGLSGSDGNGFGLNKHFYFRSGLTWNESKTEYTKVEYVDQYTSIGESDQLGTCKLNKQLLDIFTDENNRKYYDIEIIGSASKLYLSDNEKKYNKELGQRRGDAVKYLILSKLTQMFGSKFATEYDNDNRIKVITTGSDDSGVAGAKPDNMHEIEVKKERQSTIHFLRNSITPIKAKVETNQLQNEDILKIDLEIQALEKKLKEIKNNNSKTKVNNNIYNEKSEAMLMGTQSIEKNEFVPLFHSQTPEDFHRRLTFLQQCTRQGSAKRYDVVDAAGSLRARNSVFGRQPICILRIGDLFYTKVVIENVTIDYNDAPWDLNPEGFGMQPMLAEITLQMKVIGGQSLKGPIDALQNAVSFNYYANSNFNGRGIYGRPTIEANKQEQYMNGIDGNSGILGDKQKKLNDAYDELLELRKGDDE